MKRSLPKVLALLCLCAPTLALAQEGAPRGPADIMKRAAQAKQKPALLPADKPAGAPNAAAPAPAKDAASGQSGELPSGHPQLPAADGEALPPGHPPTDAQAGEAEANPPVGNDPHAHAEGAPPLARRALAESEPSADVPVGSIRVKVLDGAEKPVPGAQLQLGTMSQEAGRTATPGETGADGTFVFSNLPNGDKQAYRVNVLHQGAKYSSMPFRLPVDRGYDVVIRRLDVTNDAREVVLYVGATSVELKDERLRIVQQARLVNIGSKTYVFPADGQLLRFPKEATAFQAEEVMTDQHMREAAGEGVRITGSIPPGEVTLTWGFDIPQTESTAELNFELPWITFAYRVLADAAPGMTLQVDDMPAPELVTDRGRRLLVTEVVKRVGDTPMRAVHIKIAGIPGPGPLRFIAVGLAIAVLGLGFLVARMTAGVSTGAGAVALHDLQLEKERLLARAKALEEEHARGDIGPEFHKTALSELEEQLSGILYEQQRLAQPGKPARPG
jgi:hypothetical protein